MSQKWVACPPKEIRKEFIRQYDQRLTRTEHLLATREPPDAFAEFSPVWYDFRAMPKLNFYRPFIYAPPMRVPAPRRVHLLPAAER